jgi:predicted PurR-regulated permease PerM
MKYLNHRLSAAMWSRVLLLWLTLAIGALVVGGIAVGLGQFIQDNIRNELASQQISFTPADRLSDEERQLPGMIENAGQPLTTGNQARIYSDLIALHTRQAAEAAGYPDATYATLGGIQRELRAAVADATESGDEAALEAAQTELTTVTNLRNTLLTGSNLRGNLFSAYGWDNVATGVTAAGGFILVLAVVFFVLFFYELRRGHLPPTEA